ncbi:MAG TPA: hypothetical protein EYQ27_06540 [Gemmatimonadetes bacterium]|nr:hypothetical protein [Gemmatimonadota bacterium]
MQTSIGSAPTRAVPFLIGLLLFGCDSPTGPMGPATDVLDQFRVEGILMTASVRVLGDDGIEVTLTAMNETDFDAQAGILGGNCMLRPRVYTERGGQLVWSAFDLFDACQEPLRLFQLGGGDEESISRDFEIDVEAGDYFVTLTIEHTSLVELAAGSISWR